MKARRSASAKPAEFFSALIRSGYLPQELPPAITTRDFAAFCKNQHAFLNSQKGLIFRSNTHYGSFSAPNPRFGRRNLALVHPLGQLAVSLAVTEHRSEIKKLINQSGVSLYETTEDIVQEKAFKGLDFPKWHTLKSKIQSEYPFILYADISSFFYSIYTHSIPWAVIGKEQAKKWSIHDKAKLNAHWSNDFDKAVQCCQSKETFGVPVGPDTSRIIAEILMAGIDADPDFSIWLKRRTAFRLVDDLSIGFDREDQAYKALGALRSVLWKFNFRLNDEKTKVLPSRTSLREKWEIELEVLPLSDVNPRQQSEDIVRLLDLTLHYCAEAGTDNPALRTCQRLARLKDVENNFSSILDTIFRLAREFPRCISHVASFVINNQKTCGRKAYRDRITRWIRETLNTHSVHDHDYEVAWSLVVCGAMKIKVRKSDIKTGGHLPNPIVLALLGLLGEQKLLAVPFSSWPWRAEFKRAGIYGQNWLPFYEAVRRKWTADKTLIRAVKADPIMEKMLANKVTFLDRRVFEAESIDIASRVFRSSRSERAMRASLKRTRTRGIRGFGDVVINPPDLEY